MNDIFNANVKILVFLTYKTSKPLFNQFLTSFKQIQLLKYLLYQKNDVVITFSKCSSIK